MNWVVRLKRRWIRERLSGSVGILTGWIEWFDWNVGRLERYWMFSWRINQMNWLVRLKRRWIRERLSGSVGVLTRWIEWFDWNVNLSGVVWFNWSTSIGSMKWLNWRINRFKTWIGSIKILICWVNRCRRWCFSSVSDVLSSRNVCSCEKCRLCVRFGVRRILYVNPCTAVFCSVQKCVLVGLRFKPALMSVVRTGTVRYSREFSWLSQRG